MPAHIVLVGRYGNAVLACVFVVCVLAGLSRSFGIVVFGLTGLALAVFNIYVLEKSARLLGEEETLKSELRKMDLRRQINEAYGTLPRPGGQP